MPDLLALTAAAQAAVLDLDDALSQLEARLPEPPVQLSPGHTLANVRAHLSGLRDRLLSADAGERERGTGGLEALLRIVEIHRNPPEPAPNWTEL